MKTCSRCQRDDVEFAVKTKNGKIGLQPYCKDCNKQYHRQHYYDNKQDYFEKNKQRRVALYEEFLRHMEGKSCLDCGNTDVRVLEFDHRIAASKIANVSRLNNTASWKTLESEMNKCDIVCCNCHRIRTLTRINSRKLGLSSIGKDKSLSSSEAEFNSP